MSIVSCYIIVNADTTVEQDFDHHSRIQITTSDYSSVHLLLPGNHAAATTFLNNLITTCARLVDHIQQTPEPDTVKTEPAGATSNAHDNPAHTSEPGPHERLNRGQISRRNSPPRQPHPGARTPCWRHSATRTLLYRTSSTEPTGRAHPSPNSASSAGRLTPSSSFSGTSLPRTLSASSEAARLACRRLSGEWWRARPQRVSSLHRRHIAACGASGGRLRASHAAHRSGYGP